MADFDEIFDWVVIGSGAGSMSSALQMNARGKSVVILEKAQWVGGTTAKSGGVMWIPNNRFMPKGEDTPDKAIAYMDAAADDSGDELQTGHARRVRYVAEAPRMVDFLVEQGVALERCSQFYPDYYDELPGGCKTSRTVSAKIFNKKELGAWAPRLRQGFFEVPVRLEDGMMLPFVKKSWKVKRKFAQIAFAVVMGKITGKHWVTAGAALQGRILQQVLKTKIDIRLNTPVEHIVVENGRALGVTTTKDGEPWRIGARLGVLVNAGGFALNAEMRAKYQPHSELAWSNGIESDTGDMHVELEKLGAVLSEMDSFVGTPTTNEPGFEGKYVKPSMHMVTCKPHAILVDQSGVRYMNEGGSYSLYCDSMINRNKMVKAIPSWAIMDANYMKDYALGDHQPGKPIPKEWISSGFLKMAETIEGLAAQIGVEPAVLKATVERWNGFVNKGRDEDFHRGERAFDNFLGDPFFKDGPNKCMARLDRAPYYAAQVLPGDVGTFGGAIADENARILLGDGTPIENLYGCGVSTRSMMGRVYAGAGQSVGPSMCFGWIAAKHALGEYGRNAPAEKELA